MAICTGYRYGTGHYPHYTRSRQNTDNWNNWELCYNCALILHPNFYKKRKKSKLKRHSKKKKLKISIQEF